jgi:hypothetical protein
MFRRFNPHTWLARYEAAGGKFVVVGKGALTLSRWPSQRIEKLQAEILRDRRKWVAIYQLASLRAG